MKVSCYREKDRRPHVKVLEVVDLDVGLAHAVEEEFGSLEDPGDLEVGRIQRRRRRGRRRRRRSYDPVPGLVHLAGHGEDRGSATFVGLIVYDSRSALIDFLLSHWDADGPGELAERLQDIRRGRRTVAQRRVDLETFLRRVDDCRAVADLPLVDADSMNLDHHGWVRLDRRGETYHCRSHNDALAVAIERTVEVAGVVVPHHEWLILGAGRNEQVLHLDRGVTRRYGGYEELPDAVYRRFDEFGKVWPAAARGHVPMAEMWPRFLLRVPEHMDCNDVVADPDEALPPCFLVEPRLLSDPTRLLDELPIIDDPAAVRAVLSRTVGGVYLPGNPPAADLEPPSVQLLVGALPSVGEGR